MSNRMPVLFVGHGSPMNAISENDFKRVWQSLCKMLPKPRCILCVSAHWETRGVFATATTRPETIHDFYGFPKELYEVQYSAPGSVDLALRTAELLSPQRVRLDAGRGLDHGAWSVLMAMYPAADIPVVQLSIDSAEIGAWHYELAGRLKPLRDEGVLILGSGNIVHNLALWNWRDIAPSDWGLRFTEWIKDCLLREDHAAICAWPNLGADAILSVPSPEHFLPLLYVVAQQDKGELVQFLADRVIGTMGMTCLLIGHGQLAPESL